MSIILPPAIAGYFAADKQESTTMAQYFTENAVVVDERKNAAIILENRAITRLEVGV